MKMVAANANARLTFDLLLLDGVRLGALLWIRLAGEERRRGLAMSSSAAARARLFRVGAW